ncbi:hypothetical protein [Fodinicola acaciae]|uniref:hypothetical protein n=1 Tax=Fodinicola acaciae TaxID=2681555 RepID=UPI0013D5FF12|nr:hypothetical protein [Fodinicola acaciae]
MRRLVPVIVLILLAPTVAEVLIGDLPFTPSSVAGFLFAVPAYGGAAVLIRELVWRRGRGWPSILLLGAAYGIVEEGLALRSLFSATIYHGIGPDWGARILGVNGVYAEVQIINHAVWSIAVPILLVELLFPRWQRKPLLRWFGLIVTTGFFLAGVAIFGLSARTTLDPGGVVPSASLIAAAVVVVALAIAALIAIPRAQAVRGNRTTPTPWLVFVTALVGSFMALGVLVLPARAHLLHAPLVVVPMLASAAIVVVMWRLVSRWNSDDRHLLALGGGTLLGHSLLWGLTQPQTTRDRLVVAALIVVTAAILAAWSRRLAGTRSPHDASDPHGVQEQST